MEGYPNQLSEKVEQLPPTVPQNILGDHDMFMVRGLNLELADQLLIRSREEHIQAFCPNDSTKRFHDLESIVNWHEKGRLALPLVREIGAGSLELMGMGWLGPGKPAENEPHIPGASTTFAIRLYQGALGQRLATPYTRAMLVAHEQIMGTNKGVWLEAWGDNVTATSTYARVGFRQVDRVEDVRHGEPKPRVYMVLDSLILR